MSSVAPSRTPHKPVCVHVNPDVWAQFCDLAARDGLSASAKIRLVTSRSVANARRRSLTQPGVS